MGKWRHLLRESYDKVLHLHKTPIEYAFLIAILALFLIRCSSVFYVRFQPDMILQEYLEWNTGKAFFSDDKIYTLAGWLYINGESPDVFNFEHPPLAKYLIGVSELLFNNQAALSLAVSVSTLIFVYLIFRGAVTTFPFALLPVFILSLDRMYISFSSTSMLDIYATLFVVLSAYLLVNVKRKGAPVLLYAAVGLALSCKWITAFLLVLLPLYYVIKKDSNQLKCYPLGLALTALTYTLSYTSFFLAGNTLQEFFSLQFNIFTYHQQMRLKMGMPPPLWILLNFLTGIEGPTQIQTLFLNTNELTITTALPESGLALINAYNPLTWPISFSATILAAYYSLKENRQIVAIPLAFLILLASVSYGKTFIWYLLPVLPFAFISLAYVTDRVYGESRKRIATKIALILYLILLVVWSTLVEVPPYLKTLM
jgi:4-amino-4-deoxy-L-arabinose transferase-like glycosyltransferase